MKSLFTTAFLLLSSIYSFCYAQENIQQLPTIQQPLSKMDKFISKGGVLIKFEDYNCSALNQTFGIFAETRVRKIYSDGEFKLFYQISNQTKYGSYVASVAYEDFGELKKGLATLKSQLESDLKSKADYLENKYTTEDGLHLGYWVKSGRATWYMRLEKYSSGSLISLKNIDTIEDSFKCASDKFEEMK